MAWLRPGIWFRCIILVTIFSELTLSEQLSDEKLHCTADRCDTDGKDVIAEDAEEEGESGIHLAYSCSAPHFVSEEDVPVIMLHGLTDTRRTWDGIYQNIPVLTHRKACVYDARNHGDSSWNDTFNVDVLAEDLGHFMNKLKFEKAVLVGHSMGGLTAMKFALNNPNRVDRLFVEDITPFTLPKQGMAFAAAWVSLLKSSISQVPKGADETTARKTVMDYIQEAAHTPLPDSWVTHTPIHLHEGTWQWKMNYNVINGIFENFDLFHTTPEGRYDGKAYFIYGMDSVFKVDEQEGDIKKLFPNSEFFGVEGAGHVIHSIHSEFVTKLIKFLH